MTERIHKLSDDLVNKIAAGEVVERPSSVVKELVENSLDAQATQIDVEILDGGKTLIEVSDNGVGILPEDLLLAVHRHATSKIKDYQDLFALQTRGFRGEALASICGVAKVTVMSQRGVGVAHEIRLEAGQLIHEGVVARGLGTTVKVKQLFYHTPARLKFLKSHATETSHIIDIITKLALAHASVGFCLRENQKTVLKVQPATDLLKRVSDILGAEMGQNLYPVSALADGYELRALVGHPAISRSQRGFGYFFVNGRPIQDKTIWHAVMSAYQSLLMKGRYPVIVLLLTIPPDEVDVNVHPAKTEVRFHKTQKIHDLVNRTIRDLLAAAPWATKTEDLPAQSEAVSQKFEPQTLAPLLDNWSQKYFSASPLVANKNYNNRVLPQQPQASEVLTNVSLGSNMQVQVTRVPYAHLQPLAQLHGTYILCESDTGLVLIDQHAAHERIGYEKLLLQYQKDGIARQAMLLPYTFECSANVTGLLQSLTAEFLKFGFELAYFGGNSFAVTAEPALFAGKFDTKKLLEDLLDDIKQTGQAHALNQHWQHILATMACHGQIRAHHFLAQAEMQALLTELDEFQFTDFCPHGRPVLFEVTKHEIEKRFKRVV